MFRTLAVTLTAVSAFVCHSTAAAEYASSVIAYSPGTGFATDFATGQGLTNTAAALGEPSRSTPGQFGGPVDPFNPPYLGEQIVSIGAGGFLTLGFSTPIRNNPLNPFGIDFNVFGNAGFVITNGNFSGGGITDGTLFGANSGSSVVSVSADGVEYFQLDPARARNVDAFFPTDGAGAFELALDPGLDGSAFAGLDLEGIRGLYNGAAGGTGFDLAWAQDGAGQGVSLPEVRFVRISVLSGAAEVDGLAVVTAVPEPGPSLLLLFALGLVASVRLRGARGPMMRRFSSVLPLAIVALWLAPRLEAAVLEEAFDSAPAARGWVATGNTNLFRWDPITGALEVEWNSSEPASYFFRPLGTVLTKDDNVSVRFDLRLHELTPGVAPGKPFTFEIAVGLLNVRDATSTNFLRGTGRQSPNLMEFDYFADTGFGATISALIVSSNNLFVPSFTFPLELTLEDQFRVEMRYSAETRTLTTVMERNGAPFGPIKPVALGPGFTDFRLDAFAIASYNDAGSDGSVQARGTMDNILITTPDPPPLMAHGMLGGNGWAVSILSRTNWVYTLERTVDWQVWERAGEPLRGTGGDLELRDNAAEVLEHAYYRVRLERP